MIDPHAVLVVAEIAAVRPHYVEVAVEIDVAEVDVLAERVVERHALGDLGCGVGETLRGTRLRKRGQGDEKRERDT